jgi:tRNA A37 threonylcarbamoyladenosine dehydratase
MRLPPLRLAVSVHLVGCGVRSRSGLISTRMCGGPAEDEAYQARFRGNSAIYGEEGQRRLRDSNVCVVGVGGVGSWCVESLARSGVGKITLIDL